MSPPSGLARAARVEGPRHHARGQRALAGAHLEPGAGLRQPRRDVAQRDRALQGGAEGAAGHPPGGTPARLDRHVVTWHAPAFERQPGELAVEAVLVLAHEGLADEEVRLAEL